MLPALGWLMLACTAPRLAEAAHVPASSIPSVDLIQPAAFAAQLQTPGAAIPLILQVGSRVLYAQSHIAGSEYAGPAAEDSGVEALRQRVAQLSKETDIVLYCGCCPWSHCPNIAVAYRRLRELGFHHLKVLYLANDFGTDWVQKGYPVATG
jgi:thiosulfate/3-mercaptopyruvate sulfurtransferase